MRRTAVRIWEWGEETTRITIPAWSGQGFPHTEILLPSAKVPRAVREYLSCVKRRPVIITARVNVFCESEDKLVIDKWEL